MYLDIHITDMRSINELLININYFYYGKEVIKITENKATFKSELNKVSSEYKNTCEVVIVPDNYGAHIRLSCNANIIKKQNNIFSEIYRFLVLRPDAVMLEYSGKTDWQTLIPMYINAKLKIK